jgi:hypothetical protein
MNRFFYLILFSFSVSLSYSQEALKPLSANLNYYYKDLKPIFLAKPSEASGQRPQASSLQLPFSEDFYYSTTSSYPDQNKWSDSLVYVNSGFAIAPLSIGVATFDGLNKHGYPYDPITPNLTLSRPADTLTSKPINLYTKASAILAPSDNVALSFYYQARGNGDSPEVNDSLILDLYKPNQKRWQTTVWYALGNSNSNTNDTAFKRAFIRVKDTAYFFDGFKFRFRNFASPTGNFDHWNVDYIFLDIGRDTIFKDTLRDDLTFGTLPSSFLRDYSSMPFQQYRTYEMAPNASVRIRYNGGSAINMGYTYRMYEKNSASILKEYKRLNNHHPFWPNSYPGQTASGYSKNLSFSWPSVDTSYSQMTDSADFIIRHFVSKDNGVDFIKENDTVTQFQRFRNYYAFDDGSAEGGYYINANLAKMGVKIRLNEKDSLRALRIYFDPVGNVNKISSSTSDYLFTINVWSDVNGVPSNDPIYRDSIGDNRPSYLKTGFKEIPEYRLNKPLVLPAGTYFIGIQQKAQQLTVGFDKNYDTHSSLYYDSGSGWTQSQIRGSIMIRPVFGKTIPPPVGINENDLTEKNKFLVYPNPSSDQFTIYTNSNEINSYRLYNGIGQLVKEDIMQSNEHNVETGSLNSGIYFLMIQTNGKTVQQQKIILQH